MTPRSSARRAATGAELADSGTGTTADATTPATPADAASGTTTSTDDGLGPSEAGEQPVEQQSPPPTSEPEPEPAPEPEHAPEPESARPPERDLAADFPAVDPSELVAAELASRRRRWPILLLGIAAGAAGTYGALTYLDAANGSDDAPAAEAVALTTAPVESRDLLEEVEWAGTLQYGDPIDVTGAGGTVTSATPTGTSLSRGDVIATVDEEPVVVLYGQRPLWRTLRDGVVGVDVLLLETNLVALGYDPDVTVTVDEEFTANTALMVERWQEDLGREITGSVEVTDVVLIPGPAVITSAAVVGSSAQGTLATISSDRTVTDVVSAVAGQITEPATPGTVVEHGTVLYLVDEVPVVAVSAAEVGADPVLEVMTSTTFTTLELEEALSATGHDPDGEMTVDGSVTAATTAAVERWQRATGLVVTGEHEPGYYRLMAIGQAVDDLLEVEHSSGTLRPVLTASNSELRVEIVVGVADADEFVEGQSVSIELADESVVDGSVVEVGLVERETPQSDPTVTIAIEVLAGSDQELVEGNATVTTVSEAIEGATAVPTRALVSLAEGGFAVEVAEPGGATRLVAVELGAFDDGYVEVVEGEISPGDDVVVPR
ncbi:MAG: peptidoglycan-binding protein [Acidimicrobiales bacterium]